MSTYPLEELLNLWLREELTTEQVIGQLIRHLLILRQEIDALKRRPMKGRADKEA